MPGFTFRQLTTRPLAVGHCRVLLDVAWTSGTKYRVKLATGVRCLPAHFDPDAKPGKMVSTKDKNSSNLNGKLTKLLGDVQGLFSKAEVLGEPVTPEQLLALTTPEPTTTATQDVAVLQPAQEPSFADLFAEWKAERPRSNADSLRRYQQVVGHLDKFHPGMKLSQLTRQVFIKYTEYLQGTGMADGTVAQHVKFLRICHRLSERHIPAWLAMKVRYGRAVSLRQEELRALRDAPVPPGKMYLEHERERLLFQTQMLLRDSDLRGLREHHVTEERLPGFGLVPMLRFYQKKTGDEVRLPLPPLAASIWQRWAGKVPVVSQQRRNTFLKELAKLAGLERPFVRVRFKGGEPIEEPLPIWQVITTHTPRHTGADMVLWGSEGDQNLKEVALGHLAGASVYGYDTPERYGPLLLRAWARVGAMGESAPTPAPTPPGKTVNCAPVENALRPVLTRFVG